MQFCLTVAGRPRLVLNVFQRLTQDIPVSTLALKKLLYKKPFIKSGSRFPFCIKKIQLAVSQLV
jgi:hypothetical protein